MALAENAVLLARVALLRRDEAQAAVLMLMVVPVHEAADPFAGRSDVHKAADGILRPVLEGAKDRLGEGVVVADPRARVPVFVKVVVR